MLGQSFQQISDANRRIQTPNSESNISRDGSDVVYTEVNRTRSVIVLIIQQIRIGPSRKVQKEYRPARIYASEIRIIVVVDNIEGRRIASALGQFVGYSQGVVNPESWPILQIGLGQAQKYIIALQARIKELEDIIQSKGISSEIDNRGNPTLRLRSIPRVTLLRGILSAQIRISAGLRT